jgi:hypothetical protein
MVQIKYGIANSFVILVFPVIVVQTSVGWFFEISKNCRFEFLKKFKIKELLVLVISESLKN